MSHNIIATNPEQLGKIIEQRRNQLALSQQDLREQSSISASTISRTENGNLNTRLGSLFILLHALDLEISITVKKPDTKNQDHNGVW